MAPTDKVSAAGAASYSSDNMVVGDGTWDFTKNDFLLPNLQGLPFDMMRYNGMGNRFSTLTQYHTLILAHGVIAAIVFLALVPSGIMMARFYRGPPGRAIRYHAYCQVLAILLLTIVFILGFFAVGPERALTNPHHGIGVAIYVLVLVNGIHGLFITHIQKVSLRVMLHHWIGRAAALLGIVQIPLGLTLYGSPKTLFILFALWGTFLLVLYFILSYRREKYRDQLLIHGGRSEVTGYDVSERTEKTRMGWLGPLAAGGAIWALLRRKDRKERERSRSRTRSQSRSRVPEVIPSRRGSSSYFEEEKYSDARSRRRKGGGFVDGLVGAAGAIGAGALASRLFGGRRRRQRDDDYSAVATETPRRDRRRRDSMSGFTETEVTNRPRRDSRSGYTETGYTDDMTELTRDDRRRDRRDDGRSSLLPGPGNPVAAAAALSASEPRTKRPTTPRPSQSRRTGSRYDNSYVDSDYSSYMSPSQRAKEEQEVKSAGKGVLAGLGLGWLARRMQDRKEKKNQEDRMRYEDERREGLHGSRYTADGYGSPQRRASRRPPPPRAATITTVTGDSELSSSIEPRPPGTSSAGPPMPPLVPAGTDPSVAPRHGSRTRSASRSGRDVSAPTRMPPMPPDPRGVLHREESESEGYASASGPSRSRHSSRRRRRGEEAAVAAAASAGALAAEEEELHRRRDQSRPRPPSQPLSVKVKYNDNADRVTLRRLTDDEASRHAHSRHRSSSISSGSAAEGPSMHSYRRDSSARRTAEEEAAERLASEPLSPPQPAFAGGRRVTKDSAYYSGPPPGTPPQGNPTVSSVNSPQTHGTWSEISPSGSGTVTQGPTGSTTVSAADRRRKRRLERRASTRPSTGSVDYN